MRECRDNFTPGQKAVMLKTLPKNKYAKAWDTNRDNSEFYDFDAFEPDNTRGMASELVFDAVQNHTFHKIFNEYKEKDTDADEDWLYFDLKDAGKQSFTIKITKSVQKQTAVNVQIFDDAGEIRKFLILPTIDDKGFKVENISKGRYFIRISKQNSTDFLSGYKILLTK